MSGGLWSMTNCIMTKRTAVAVRFVLKSETSFCLDDPKYDRVALSADGVCCSQIYRTHPVEDSDSSGFSINRGECRVAYSPDNIISGSSFIEL